MSKMDVRIESRGQMQQTLVLLLVVLFTVPGTGQISNIGGFKTQDEARRKKVNSKDDISAIGHRNIGKRGVGNWYSLQSEISLGRELAKSIESQTTILNDPAVIEYVNRVAQVLVRNSDAQVTFTIRVIDSDELNAFSLPGGFVYVTSGLITACNSEAELASALTHEIAHVAARHATRRKTRSNLLGLASLPLTFVGAGFAADASQELSPFGMDLILYKFSRGFEAEADYLGLEYLYAAGYDPQAFLALLERASSEEEDTGMLANLFSTHPRIPGRLRKAQQEIVRILRPRELYVVNTSDFDTIKKHLLTIHGARGGNSRYSDPEE